jgi:hypothetical protein
MIGSSWCILLPTFVKRQALFETRLNSGAACLVRVHGAAVFQGSLISFLYLTNGIVIRQYFSTHPKVFSTAADNSNITVYMPDNKGKPE